MRILVYCQHVLGIGHLVRTFEILKALKGHQITLLLGGSEINLAPPEHVTIVQLPPLMMDATFSTLSTATGEPLEGIKKKRQQIISDCLRTVQPGILLIELYPFGRNSFHFEIAPLLEQTKQAMPTCLIASSVRDILVNRDNRLKFEKRAVERLNHFFDLLLIHSDPAVIRLNETFSRMEDLNIETIYTGYVHRPPKQHNSVQKRKDDLPLIVASAGGGSVGYALLEATLKAHSLLPTQVPCILHLYTGPYLEHDKRQKLIKLAGDHAQIATFCDDLPATLRQAALSISMGGYNTTMDVVAAGCPALIYPFNQNHEQRLRAERLQHYVPITILEAKDLLPTILAQYMHKALHTSSSVSKQIAMDGANQTAQTLIANAKTKRGHMKNLPAPLWMAPLPLDTETRLRTILSAHTNTPIFFRADDIGGKKDPLFDPLMKLFLAHRVPLCLAVVPTWIDTVIWANYEKYQPQSTQWCWHQHGYSHTNHEQTGKKAEFGLTRSKQDVQQEIVNGKNKLAALLGDAFTPVFTPPWNRCSSQTLQTLSEQSFCAVSRSRQATPLPPAELPDIQINIDPHTRKEQDAAASWEALYVELRQAADAGLMGVMLHHQLMNQHGLAFLDLLLRLVQEYQLPACTFQEICKGS